MTKGGGIEIHVKEKKESKQRGGGGATKVRGRQYSTGGGGEFSPAGTVERKQKDLATKPVQNKEGKLGAGAVIEF